MMPEQIAKESEDSHQIALLCWCNLNLARYPQLKWLFHVPNGGARDKREGAKFKAMGVKRGVPDLHLIWEVGIYKGLIIELKNDKGVLSVEQSEWLAHYYSQGYKIVVCYGWESARDTIIIYLEGRRE